MITFLCGFVFEVSYLAWLYIADKGSPWVAGLLSMFVGGMSLLGIGVALRDPWQAPWLLLGYGLGSVCCVFWKRHAES